jgi:hypothetical protein
MNVFDVYMSLSRLLTMVSSAQEGIRDEEQRQNGVAAVMRWPTNLEAKVEAVQVGLQCFWLEQALVPWWSNQLPHSLSKPSFSRQRRVQDGIKCSTQKQTNKTNK